MTAALAPRVELDEQTRSELAPRCQWSVFELNVSTGRRRLLERCDLAAVWALTFRCPRGSALPLVLSCEEHSGEFSSCPHHIVDHLELVSAVRL